MKFPRLTEVFVIHESLKKLSFQQLKSHNALAAKTWQEQVTELTDGQDTGVDTQFTLEDLRLSTDSGYIWDPVKKFWDLEGNFPSHG